MPTDIEFPTTYKAGMYLNLPPRDPSFPTGSQFGQSILNLGPTQERDNLIANEFYRGNVPDFMRLMSSITINNGNDNLTYYVSPDVLCIGSNEDFLRCSLMPGTARKIMDICQCMLPTKRICDQIWNQANLKLTPQPIGASPTMSSTLTFIQHNNLIEQQRAGRLFDIITGHKKDVVMSKYLLQDPSRVAIYGWFYPNGVPIQGLQAHAHDKNYQDYSHSCRLVSRACSFNNTQYDLFEILNNPILCYLISDESAFNALSIYL